MTRYNDLIYRSKNGTNNALIGIKKQGTEQRPVFIVHIALEWWYNVTENIAYGWTKKT